MLTESPLASPQHAAFYEAANRGELVLPQCQTCEEWHWYPLPRCPHCRAIWSWSSVAAKGTLFSWTVVRHAFDRELRDAVPFVVALVEMTDAPGVRLISNLVEFEPRNLAIGTRLVARFEPPVWSSQPLPVFTPI